MSESTLQYPPLPADDLKRNLTLAQIDQDKSLPPVSYTHLLQPESGIRRLCRDA